jgi:hypothetical protein
VGARQQPRQKPQQPAAQTQQAQQQQQQQQQQQTQQQAKKTLFDLLDESSGTKSKRVKAREKRAERRERLQVRQEQEMHLAEQARTILSAWQANTARLAAQQEERELAALRATYGMGGTAGMPGQTVQPPPPPPRVVGQQPSPVVQQPSRPAGQRTGSLADLLNGGVRRQQAPAVAAAPQLAAAPAPVAQKGGMPADWEPRKVVFAEPKEPDLNPDALRTLLLNVSCAACCLCAAWCYGPDGCGPASGYVQWSPWVACGWLMTPCVLLHNVFCMAEHDQQHRAMSAGASCLCTAPRGHCTSAGAPHTLCWHCCWTPCMPCCQADPAFQ